MMRKGFLPILRRKVVPDRVRTIEQSIDRRIRALEGDLLEPPGAPTAAHELGPKLTDGDRVKLIKRQVNQPRLIFPHTLRRPTPPSGKMLRRTCVTGPFVISSFSNE